MLTDQFEENPGRKITLVFFLYLKNIYSTQFASIILILHQLSSMNSRELNLGIMVIKEFCEINQKRVTLRHIETLERTKN
jgi:hypothetical protein